MAQVSQCARFLMGIMMLPALYDYVRGKGANAHTVLGTH